MAGTYLTQSGRTVAFEDNAAGGVTARVRVAGGGSLTILGIPSGTSYTVSEADYTADRYTTTSTALSAWWKRRRYAQPSSTRAPIRVTAR